MKREGQFLASLVAAMSQPGFYPERPAKIEIIQTHISYVFIAGDAVYKIRKPIRFAFLDYSSLERRYHFSQEEVRLNRRLAPHVYLGVFAIVYREGGFVLGEQVSAPDGPDVVEYAVKMRRLPEDRMLERLVGEGRVGKEEIRRIADRIAEFHLSASTECAAKYGEPSAIWQAVSENLAECEPFVGETVSKPEYEKIARFVRGFAETHRELFRQRISQGRVREGHGDLRCEHICLSDGIVVFDCVEYSEQLRYCDVASDVGFLAMDLDRLGASALGDELVAAYVEKTGDRALFELLRFYKCHRAVVRGKVQSLKSREAEVSEAERDKARNLALMCFRLAYQYVRGAEPALVAVCGLAGTGKSTVARTLARHTGFVVFNSDVIRKRLFGLDPTSRTGAGYGAGIYDPHATERTYDALLAAAAKTLADGKGVIVDATFKDAAHRWRFVAMARRLSVPVVFVECRADESEVMRRLLARERRADEVSDATMEVYARQKAEFAPFGEAYDHCHLVVDGRKDPERIALRIEAYLDNLR